MRLTRLLSLILIAATVLLSAPVSAQFATDQLGTIERSKITPYLGGTALTGTAGPVT